MLFYPFTSRVTYDEQGLPLYDRAVDSAFLRDFYKAYWSDGVFYDPTTSFQVTAAGAGMALQVAPGKAQIQGAFAVESAVQSLSVAEADTTNNRIDTVVLRLDLSLDKRSIELAVLKGTPATEPIAPTLTRNSTVWELGLANITVRKNVSALTQLDITDTRLDTQRCGVVAQTIGKLDTSAYFLQSQAALEQIQKELSDLNAGSATMLKDEYDLDRTVLTAGGIKAYTDERLQPVQTSLSGLAADVGKLQTDVGNLKGVSVALNPESWSGGAPYTQTIQVEWMTADWVAGCPTLNVDACHGDVDTIKQRKEEFAKLGMITSSNGALTFTAFEERPWTWLDLDIPRFVKK